MNEKFNVERLLRSVGFSADIQGFDNDGKPVVKKDDYGTSRFYDHPIGVRVELVYDNNKLRKPENLLYYQFVDFRPIDIKLTDNVKKILTELNEIINSRFDELLLNNELLKHICNKPELTVSVYRTHSIDKTLYDNDIDYWMAIFDDLGWNVSKDTETQI